MKKSQYFFHQLVLAYRPFEVKLNEQLSKHQLHRAQWSILYHLANNHSMTLVEISKVLGVEKPTVTRTMYSLEEQGLVEQVASQDRREKRMVLTKKGHELFNEVRVSVDAFEEELLLEVSEEEQELFIQILQRVREKLDRS